MLTPLLYSLLKNYFQCPDVITLFCLLIPNSGLVIVRSTQNAFVPKLGLTRGSGLKLKSESPAHYTPSILHPPHRNVTFGRQGCSCCGCLCIGTLAAVLLSALQYGFSQFVVLPQSQSGVHTHTHKATRTNTQTVNPTAGLLCHTGDAV